MSLISQVIAPILKNEKNLDMFPKCVADDIKRQVHELSTAVYQIRGHIKGKTLLPFPQQGAKAIEEEEKKVADCQIFYFKCLEVIGSLNVPGP